MSAEAVTGDGGKQARPPGSLQPELNLSADSTASLALAKVQMCMGMLEGNHTSHLAQRPSDRTNGWLSVMSIGNVDKGRELCWVTICPPSQPMSPALPLFLYTVKPTTAPSQRQNRHDNAWPTSVAGCRSEQ